MDDGPVVSTISKKSNCAFCGVFHRQTLDRGAATLGMDHIVTGHNAGDVAETALMNSTSVPSPVVIIPHRRAVMRGEIARLGRCAAICTQREDTIRWSNPFKYAYEKEIVTYAWRPLPSFRFTLLTTAEVRVLQEARLLYRVHLLAGHVPRARACVPEGSRGGGAQRDN